MSITDTLAKARNDATHRLSEAKMDRTARENDELKTENRLLRDELAESRSERQHVLELLDKAQISVSGPTKRRFKVLRLVAMGGAVYAVAVNTGAMDRIRAWFDEMRGKSQQLGSEFASKGSDVTHQVGDVVEHTGRKLEEAGAKIERTGDTLEQKARKIGQ